MSIGVATLLAGVLVWLGIAGGTPSPIPAVAGAFIDRTPPWLKDFAVSTFGTNDKLALTIGMVVVLVAACAGIGVLSRRRRLLAIVLLGVVGALGMAAVISRPDASGPDVLPTLLGTAAGIDALFRLRPRPGDDLRTAAWNPLTRRRVIAGGGARSRPSSGCASTAAEARPARRGPRRSSRPRRSRRRSTARR